MPAYLSKTACDGDDKKCKRKVNFAISPSIFVSLHSPALLFRSSGSLLSRFHLAVAKIA